jgi:ribosome-associated protein
MTMERLPAAEELVDGGEVRFEFFRSSGPGGQNVNKVSTAVRLRFDLAHSRLLPAGVKARLSRTSGVRLTAGGDLVIEARRHRTREANRRDAVERLMDLIRRAWDKPRTRRPTKPTASSAARRLGEKRRRGEVKRGRRPADGGDV